MFLGKGVLKICSKLTWEHPCQSVISIKLLCTFIGIIFRHGCSPVNLLYIFRTPFTKITSRRLLLSNVIAKRQPNPNSSSTLVIEETMIPHMNIKSHQNLDLMIPKRKKTWKVTQVLFQRLILSIYCKNPNFENVPLIEEPIS